MNVVLNVEELTLEQLKELIREKGSRLNITSSIDIQNEINKREKRRIDIG